MSIFIGVITALYIFLLLFLLYGYNKLPLFSGKISAPLVGFSVIVAFRNEANNLPQLLYSLQHLDYPKDFYEVIVINDGSQDRSEEVCQKFANEYPDLHLKILQNTRTSGSPKKDALTTGIKTAEMEFIITTDADCRVPQNWLRDFSSKIRETGAQMIAGPVGPLACHGFWSSFQELDIYGLQAATMGGFGVDLPFMCNGGNLGYSKKGFEGVEGFEGNSEIASGDDIFLLEKFRKKGFKTVFLKSTSAVVSTALQPTFKDLIAQRVRWAAKTSAYKGFFGKAVGLTVLLMNLALIGALLGFATGNLSPMNILLPFLLKFNVDFLLIYSGARFFGREMALKNYFFISLVYPFFSSYVAISSLFKSYRWKGRRFKK